MKTLAIRLEDDQHAQLSMIAQLEDLTMIDAIRQAINQWINERRNQPGLQERAAAVLADIEHEAATRRGAIAALLGQPASVTSPTDEASGNQENRPTGRRRNPSGAPAGQSGSPGGDESATS